MYYTFIIRVHIHVWMIQLVHGSNDTSPGRPVLMYHRHVYKHHYHCHYCISHVYCMINPHIHMYTCTLVQYTGLIWMLWAHIPVLQCAPPWSKTWSGSDTSFHPSSPYTPGICASASTSWRSRPGRGIKAMCLISIHLTMAAASPSLTHRYYIWLISHE